MGIENEQLGRAIGLDVLLWIAGDPERAGSFLGATGTSVDDLRSRANDPEFLGFVMDFLLQGDTDLVAFCEDHQLRPETVLAARAALPGGNLPNWT